MSEFWDYRPIRENTERQIAIEEGTNTLVGTTEIKILKVFNEYKKANRKAGKFRELWNGKTASRIINILIPSTLYSLKKISASLG